MKKSPIEILKEANKRYREGNAIMSDIEYDELFEQANIEHLTEEAGNVDHQFIIGSLKKIKNGDAQALKAFKNKSKSDIIISTKLDGASITIYYNSGKLTKILTRGDGYKGVDVTNKLKPLMSIPKTIEKDIAVVRGEIVITHADFRSIKNNAYKHSRNAVVGLLNAKSKTDEALLLKVGTFIAYNIVSPTNERHYKKDVLDKLHNNNFIVPRYEVCSNSELTQDKLLSIYDNFLHDTSKHSTEIDGLVLQYDIAPYIDQYYPDFAIAFKPNALTAESVITGIEWSVSKNGLIKPTITFEPVVLGGATIRKCTGCNLEYMQDRGFGIGAKVVIQKMGDIIPGIGQMIQASNDIPVPTVCPTCGHATAIVGKDIVCKNKNCQGRATKSVSKFLKNIEVEFAAETSLLKWNIKTLDDLLNFVPEEGVKQQEKFYDSLVKKLFTLNKEQLLVNADYSNGIGSRVIEKLIKENGLEAVIEYFETKGKTRLIVTDGIGANLYENAATGKIIDFINKVLADPRRDDYKDMVQTAEENSAELSGVTVVFTGALSIGRTAAGKLLTAKGGKVGSAINDNTTYLVTNEDESASSKFKAALKHGTCIINEEQFMQLINGETIKPKKKIPAIVSDIENL